MTTGAESERGRRPGRGRACGRGAEGGFTAIEIIIVVLIGILITAVFAPYLSRFLRRHRLMTVVREMESIVLATRMQAVRRNQWVILQVDPVNRLAWNWADVNNNYVQDATEPTINQYMIPDTVYFRYAPNGAALNGPSAVSFDTYNGNNALVDMIVFQGNGTIVPPQANISKQPLRPSSYSTKVTQGSINCNPGQRCRGIYIADTPGTGLNADRNVFRISVDDFGQTGRVTLLKWLPASEGANSGEINYVAGPWEWYAGR
jgi:Tfp pilus assembly protein FimT